MVGVGVWQWVVVGSVGYILAGGRWWWIYFDWWWVVVDGGRWWWIYFGWWWVVVGRGIVYSNPFFIWLLCLDIRSPTFSTYKIRNNFFSFDMNIMLVLV